MFRLMFAALVFITGCSSIPTPSAHNGPRMPEPSRSEFVVQCVMRSNVPVTYCLCMEEMVVRMRGKDSSKWSQIDFLLAGQKCEEVIGPIMKEELKELIEQSLEKEREKTI
jgi:hypothetical protein